MIMPLLHVVLAAVCIAAGVTESGRAEALSFTALVPQSATVDDRHDRKGLGSIAFGPTDSGRLARLRPPLALLQNRVERPATNGGSTLLRNTAVTLSQSFDPPWNGNTSRDGLWRINGLWTGTGGNILDPSLARISSAFQGSGDRSLLLSVAADEKRGSEIQTLDEFGYGYYEVSMKVTNVPGVVASFFWIESPSYGPHEWDLEFLTNESWINSFERGQVHLTLHPSNTTFVLPLAFNPSRAFHRYGFLWTRGKIVFTVDGRPAHSFAEAELTSSAKGYIMMNTWTGNSNWGGGPPTQQATTIYKWVKFSDRTLDIPPSDDPQ